VSRPTFLIFILASAGISSSESLLSALKTPEDTTLGRPATAVCALHDTFLLEPKDIFIPKPFPPGLAFDNERVLGGETGGGLGDDDLSALSPLGFALNDEYFSVLNCGGAITGVSPAPPFGSGTPPIGFNPIGGGGIYPNGGGTGTSNDGGGAEGIIPGGGGGTPFLALSSL